MLEKNGQFAQINSLGSFRKIFPKFCLSSKKTTVLLRQTEEISTSTNVFRHVWRQRGRLGRAMTNAIKLSGTIHALLKRLPQISMRIKKIFPFTSDSFEFTRMSQEGETEKKKKSQRDGGSFLKISWAFVIFYSWKIIGPDLHNLCLSTPWLWLFFLSLLFIHILSLDGTLAHLAGISYVLPHKKQHHGAHRWGYPLDVMLFIHAWQLKPSVDKLSLILKQ